MHEAVREERGDVMAIQESARESKNRKGSSAHVAGSAASGWKRSLNEQITDEAEFWFVVRQPQWSKTTSGISM